MGDAPKRSQLLDLPNLSNGEIQITGSRKSSHKPLNPISSIQSSQRTTEATSSKDKRPLDTEDFGLTLKRIKSGKTLHGDTICETCQNINLEIALTIQCKTLQNSADGVHIAGLGTLTSENKCTSCKLFYELREPQDILDESQRYQLRAYSYLKYNTSISFKDIPSKLRAYDMPYFAVVALGSDRKDLATKAEKLGQLCIQQDGTQQCLLSPQIVPRRVDFSHATILLARCKRYHEKLCGTRETGLVGMQVIDCQLMTIIPSPANCIYAALSYVWGGGRNKAGDSTLRARSSRLVLKTLPRVVSDAIEVTKSLNLRYLWVDKYCIDQNNAVEKHDQISRMDAIYQGAELTIIAAAGSDENFGLPGVGTTPRIPQPVATMGFRQFVSTMSHPHRTIVASKWATRGWTYQEAVLSRRRLVFTESQTYFECNAMNCSESALPNFDLAHTKDKKKALRFMHSGIFTGAANFRPQDEADGDVVANAQSYLEHIQQYSKRDLSFDTDSFKAFAGIASHYERTKNHVSNAWGIPILIRPSEPNLAYVCTEPAFYWKHKHDVWSGDAKPRRRDGFPSWSWIGWGGEVEFAATAEMLYRRVRSTYLLQPPFECNSAGAIHMRTLTVNSTEIKIKDFSKPSTWLIGEWEATLNLSQDFGSPEDILTHFATGVLKLVKVVQGRPWREEDILQSFLLVVHQIENQNYERVGLMTVESDLEVTRHLRGWHERTFLLYSKSYEQLDLWLE